VLGPGGVEGAQRARVAGERGAARARDAALALEQARARRERAQQDASLALPRGQQMPQLALVRGIADRPRLALIAPAPRQIESGLGSEGRGIVEAQEEARRAG